MSNMNYSKIRCAGRIAIFLTVCLVGSVLVSAPFLSLLLNNGGDATTTQSMTDYIAMASSAFLLVALVVEDKIEKLDLWAIGRSGLQIKVVFISVFLGLLWQLSIYLICQFSNLRLLCLCSFQTDSRLFLHFFRLCKAFFRLRFLLPDLFL